MFGFLKRNSNSSPVQNWDIPLEGQYRLIRNRDSIQFSNGDQSVILYFSKLVMSDASLLPDDVLSKMKPSLTHSDAGWVFKGAKSGGREILTCVFSFTNQDDGPALENLFSKISYTGK